MKIDHIQLAILAKTEDTHRAFWVALLGFTELEKPDALKPRGGAWFASDDVEVHLGVDHDFTPAKKAHPAFRVAGLDVLADRLAKAGSPVRFDDAINGRRRFFTEDPAGNRIEFIGE